MTDDAPGGYIRIHRRIQEHPYWEDAERFRAWIDLLLMAAWKPHRRMVGTVQVELERGELIVSERFLSARWRWSRGKVRRFLEGAVEANEIEPRSSTRDGTIYLIVNYDTYQDDRPTSSTTNSTSIGPPPDQREVRDKNSSKKKKTPMGEKKKKRTRATQLPDDWEPNEGHQELARGLGLMMGSELAHFKDHHTAKGSTYKDWDAAFRTWLRKSREFKKEPPPTSEAAGVKEELPKGEKPIQPPPAPEPRKLEVDPDVKDRVKAYRNESAENERRLEYLWDQVQKEMSRLYKNGKVTPSTKQKMAEFTFFKRADKMAREGETP